MGGDGGGVAAGADTVDGPAERAADVAVLGVTWRTMYTTDANETPTRSALRRMNPRPITFSSPPAECSADEENRRQQSLRRGP
jgi:hypothetical protein